MATKNVTIVAVEEFTDLVTSRKLEAASRALAAMSPLAQQAAMETYSGLRAMIPSLRLPLKLGGAA